jgi:hypothetical protein
MKYGTKRHVNIRGYVREVTVCHKNRDGEWIVIDGKRTEAVPEYLFYHKTQTGLIMRDDLEFLRKFPDHPIEVEYVNLYG